MTDEPQPAADPHLTALLLEALHARGFVPVPPRHALSTQEAAVSNGRVTVHIDPDCARIIIEAYGQMPAHRLLIPRHVGLSVHDAVALAARYARVHFADATEEG